MTTVKNKKRILTISTIILVTLLITTITLTFYNPQTKQTNQPQIIGTIGNTQYTIPETLKTTETPDTININTHENIISLQKNSQQTTLTNTNNDLIANEQAHLEVCIDGEWRSAGQQTNFENTKINDYQQQITRTYQSSYANWQTVYDVTTGGSIKLTVNIQAKITAQYRIVWTIDVPKTFKPTIDGQKISDNTFFFDYSDVKNSLGDITTYDTSTLENGKRHVLTFDVGQIVAGNSLSLDPTFGLTNFETVTQSNNTIFGVLVNLPNNGVVTSMTAFVTSSIRAPWSQGGALAPLVPSTMKVQMGIYTYSTAQLVALTNVEPNFISQTPTVQALTLNFPTPVSLVADNYILVVWTSTPTIAYPTSSESGQAPVAYVGVGDALTYVVRIPNVVNGLTGTTLGSYPGYALIANYNEPAIYATYQPTDGQLTYSNLGYDTTIAGSMVTWSAKFQDTFGLNNYIFSTNISGSWVNATAKQFTTNPQTVYVTQTLPLIIGSTVSVIWYATNSLGQSIATTTLSLTTTSEYTQIADYMYTIIGPFLETGQVFIGRVLVSVNYPYQPSFTVTLDGTDNVVDTIIVPSSNFAANVVWNITSDGSIQRAFNFNPQDSEATVTVTVPDSNNPLQTTSMYRAFVVDFAGLAHSFVQIMRNVNGVNTVIESKPLDTLNAIPFYLINNQQYTLRVVSDQGVWAFNFPTDGVLEKTFVITQDMVPVVDPTVQVTINFERPEANVIVVNVFDSEYSLATIVTDVMFFNGREWEVVYTQTDIGSQGIYWQYADVDTDYLVVTNVYRNGADALLWQYSLSAPVGSMQLTGFFEVLGDWPFPANQLLGLFIVGLFFTLLSWRDVEVACFVGCVIAGVCVLLGLLDVSVTAIAMGFFVVVALYIHQGKKGEFNQV